MTSYAKLAHMLSVLAWRQPVTIVADAPVTLSGFYSLQGVTLAAGMSVLSNAQATGTDRVVWNVRSGAWSRRQDFEVGDPVLGGTSIRATSGTYAGEVWRVAGDGHHTVGTDVLDWERGSWMDVLEDHETKLNTPYAEAATGNAPATLIDQLTIGSLRALDAQTAEDQPDPLYIAGGRPHSSLIGVDTNHNVIHHGGIGGTALNGEGGQLNFFGGDYRVPGCPPVLCGEIGYTWQFDYDLDPTSGLPRTPYALRLHSGVNPNTNARTRLVLQGYDAVSIESEFANVLTSVTAGNAIQFGLPTSSSGNGLLEDNVSGVVQLSGATPGNITIANRIPLTKLAHCDLTVISKSTDYDSREVFRLKFTWFGTVIALVENVADVGGYPSSAGRVAVTDNGTALYIALTGLADGRTRNVTIRLRLEIQQ